MNYPPKTCSCGVQFTPRPSNYAKALRCSACALERRRRGSPGRPAHTPGSATQERGRAKLEAERSRKFHERPIIGIDGEGFTQPFSWYNEYWNEGDPDPIVHRYQFMRARSDTGEEWRLDLKPGDMYLRVNDILWWLWKLPRSASLWFFSAKYDWTHIVRDLVYSEEGRDVLDKMYHPDPEHPFEPVWWHEWGFSYIQGTFTLSRKLRDRETGNVRLDKNDNEIILRRTFQDAWKCFASGKGFLDTLKAWEVGTPEQHDQIEDMKAKRSHFEEITEEVSDYCLLEVGLLATMVKKILDIAWELDIRPAVWYSAGSAAKALLRKHRIPADSKTGWEGFRGPDRFAGAPDEFRIDLLRAYAGGRFENGETGIFKVLHSIDLAAAYPGIIRDLPCLSHGEWGRGYSPGGVNFGHVEWHSDDFVKFGPFPWRWPDGGIYYPASGEGWYYEAEIAAARTIPGVHVQEIEWISFTPHCDHKPFEWVQDVYDLRLTWGKDGRGLMLKVTLNSIYGTFADTLAIDSRYASIIWAAMITSGTRAALMKVYAEHGDEVVGFATDGILAKSAIVTTEKRKILGEWDYEGEIRDVFLIQPGLYLAADGEDPKKTFRSRGHNFKDLKELEPELRRAWLTDGWNGQVSYDRTRLIPGKLALKYKNPGEVWGQWVTQPVTVKFTPTRREPINDAGPVKRSTPSIRHYFRREPPDAPPDWNVSAPYDKFISMIANQRLIDAKELDDGQA